MSLITTPNEKPMKRADTKGSHHQRLARLGDHERQRRATIVVLSAVGMVVVLSGLLAALDFYAETVVPVRIVGWMVIVLAAAGLVVSRRRWQTYQSADAINDAERVWPDMGQRLRTSHDYQTTPEQVSPAEPELVRALEAETQQRVTSRVIEPLGRPWPIFALLALCGVTAIVWSVAMVASSDWRVATARLMFLPAHYSDVAMEPLPEHVHQGEDLVVQLHVDGRPLETARVLYRKNAEEPWTAVALQPAAAGALIDDLDAVVPDCQSDFEVRVEAGPLHSGVHSIAVRLPLVLEEWDAAVQPPSYTGLPAAEGSPEGLRIPEGSALQLAAKYNRQPSEVEVAAMPQSVASSKAKIADSEVRVLLNASGPRMDLSIRAAASDGMADDSSLHIEVVPDRRPELKFVAPDENAEAVPTAELRFTLEAFDDYGLGTVGIRYRVDDGPEQTLWERDESDPTTATAQTVTLPLEELGVSYPQAITYYAYAVDNREPEVQRVTSELRFIDIRPFSREYEFKDAQCSGNGQGECLTLEKLIKQQREILGRTFAVAQQSEPAATIVTKLAEDEGELRTKTETLTAALEEKLGPMPSLSHAIASMTDAIEKLSVQALPEGQVDQERALADLIAARKNLRTILKQCDSKSQMCRNVDQQQMDKIRKPERDREKKEEEKEEELADLREQLEQLAKEQESFCESAKACQQAGKSSSSSSGSSPASKSPNEEPATREQLAQQQQQSAEKTRALKQKLSASEFGELAPDRAERAADSIEQSGQSLANADTDSDAIELAEDAARQLKQLSEHLGRRHNPDFVDKLAVAELLAGQLADQQQQLSESLSQPSTSAAKRQDSGSKEQHGLADRGEELVDLVDQLQAESTQQEWEVQRALSEQASANSPRQAVAGMRQAAERLAKGSDKTAAEAGRQSAGILKRLAAGLKEVQQAMGPARLDQLVKAEKQAAALLKDLQRADSPAERAMAQAGTRQFAEAIRPLARGDAEMTEAAGTLSNAGSTAPTTDARDTEPESSKSEKWGRSPSTLVDGLRQVDEVLQRRIQEAILSGSMQQAVGAVPPQYSQMVDDYYRALSEDVE